MNSPLIDIAFNAELEKIAKLNPKHVALGTLGAATAAGGGYAAGHARGKKKTKAQLNRNLSIIARAAEQGGNRAFLTSSGQVRFAKAPPSATDQAEFLKNLEKKAFLRGLGRQIGRFGRGAKKTLFGTKRRAAATGLAAGLTAGGIGGAAFAASNVPARIKNSKIFQMLFRRTKQKFPDVPDGKIQQLIYQVLKEKNALQAVAGS